MCRERLSGQAHAAPVGAQIAELLGLSAEIHRVDPASGFDAAACASVPKLRNFIESGLERACDGSNHCLRYVCSFKSMTKSKADCAPSDSCCGVRNGDTHDHKDDGTRCVVEHC